MQKIFPAPAGMSQEPGTLSYSTRLSLSSPGAAAAQGGSCGGEPGQRRGPGMARPVDYSTISPSPPSTPALGMHPISSPQGLWTRA
uniref:Uncharacterized protein n=1 Tax=Arundo donax TaxID=35708 RepID=A0A0A9GUW2_ARUDO